MKKTKKEPTLITIKRLKEELAIFPDYYEIDFSGLEFSRTKNRGQNIVQIEFSEQVYRDDQGNVVVQNI